MIRVYFSLLIILASVSTGCTQGNAVQYIHTGGNTVKTRFTLPEGYERIPLSENSFGEYLRNLPLKPHGSKVKYYNGDVKEKSNVYLAVVDMEIGAKNLQQCADAVIRLRSEYLFSRKLYDKIHFNYTSGFNAEYSKWKQGYRIALNGNNARWVKSTEPSGSYEIFRKYLDNVFTYAGTASLSKEMKSIAYKDLQPGDVLIKGGSPGHTVIVIDMAIHKTTGKKIYMLAQSYMPAQDIQILCNPENKNSPWYELDEQSSNVYTPEWTFKTTEAKKFLND